MNYIKLNNGVEIPQVGLGVFRSENGEETVNAVKWALEAGYRHIDTAKAYRNEESVAAGIKASGVKREDVFITTKISTADIAEGTTAKSFEESLKKLDTDYIDLILLHWPMKDEMNITAWKVLEDYYKAGKARAIGVSNYTNRQMGVLLEAAEIVPAVNQIQIDPLRNKEEVLRYDMSKGIYLEAWSPLGGTGKTAAILGNPVIMEIAKAHGKTPAHVIIRWNIQRQVIVIPKSVHKDRIEANLDVFDFELTEEEMAKIAALEDPTAQRAFGDPETAYERDLERNR